jgi:hypothetical protein
MSLAASTSISLLSLYKPLCKRKDFEAMMTMS